MTASLDCGQFWHRRGELPRAPREAHPAGRRAVGCLAKAATDDDVHADAEAEAQALAGRLPNDAAARALRPRVLDGPGDAARLAGLRARLAELLPEQIRHLAEAIGARDGRRRARNGLPVGVGLVRRAVREVDRIAPVGVHNVDLAVP